MSESIQLTKENRRKLAYEGAKMLYGFSTLEVKNMTKIFAPPLTRKQRWLRFADKAKTVFLLAAMIICWSVSFAMIFRMINA